MLKYGGVGFFGETWGAKQMIEHVASSINKCVATGAVVVGLASFSLFADISAAVAAPTPDTGSYDEQTDLAQEGCWGGVSSPPVAFEVGDPESAGCDHSRAAGSYGPHAG
jgi:hypothetical protein